MVFTHITVAVVVSQVATVRPIAVLVRRCRDRLTGRLAAILGVSVEVGSSGEALSDHALMVHTGRQREGNLANHIATSTIEGVGRKVETLVDEAVAVVIPSVTELGTSNHTALGSRIHRRPGVVALKAVKVDLTAGADDENEGVTQSREVAHGWYPTVRKQTAQGETPPDAL